MILQHAGIIALFSLAGNVEHFSWTVLPKLRNGRKWAEIQENDLFLMLFLGTGQPPGRQAAEQDAENGPDARRKSPEE
jgi:hypothetical protein